MKLLAQAFQIIEIWVAQGTYTGLASVRSSKFVIPPRHSLCTADSLELRHLRDPAPRCRLAQPSSREILASQAMAQTTLFMLSSPCRIRFSTGSPFRDGNASENFGDGDDRGKGGGLYADSTSFSVANCIFL